MMMILTAVLLIAVMALAVGALPAWPYSSDWGYVPSGMFAIATGALMALLLTSI
jgi:hypothetical protein